MMVAYVAGPYRAATHKEVVDNIRRAEEITVNLLKRGFAVICPHKNYQWLNGIMDDDKWIPATVELVSRCDFVVMIDGWENSEGSRAEHEYAVEDGIPIFYKVEDVKYDTN